MSIEEYIKGKKDFHTMILQFLEKRSDSTDEYQNLILIFKKQKINKQKKDLSILLHLISKISNNHHRNPDFFQKIEKIILFFEDQIKQFYTNWEIFDFFKNNKLIILFLINRKFISIDHSIIKYIFKKNRKEFIKISHFLSKELEPILKPNKRSRLKKQLSKLDPNILENFEEKRLLGENDAIISSLIRNDSVIEFITYCNKNNISLSSPIEPSIYETNSFLLKNKDTTLIEYAAFYGSIQIFQFLRMNNVELKPSLWLYAIHSNNAELIHLLEENNVKPNDLTYKECLKEAIKCHHNEIAVYIKDNLIDEKKIKNKFDKDEKAFAFRYFNFVLFTNQYNCKSFFYYACKYDYLNIVEILLKTKKMNLNEKIIFEIQLFNQVFNHFYISKSYIICFI